MNILPLPFDVLLRIVERLTKVYYYALLESKTNSKTRSIHLEKSPYLPYLMTKVFLAGVEKPIIFDEKETV